MNISFREDTWHNYMVVEALGSKDTEDEERMLSNQQSWVFIPFHIREVDGHKEYCYEITGKMDLKRWLKTEKATETMIRGILRFVIEVYAITDEYLLDVDGVMMDIGYLYGNIEENRICAAYIPSLNGDFREGLKKLTGYLLEHTDHREKMGVLLAYDFYQIVRREDFTPKLLSGLLETKECVREKESETKSVLRNREKEQNSDKWEQIGNRTKEQYASEMESINRYAQEQVPKGKSLKHMGEVWTKRSLSQGYRLIGIGVIWVALLVLQRVGVVRWLLEKLGLHIGEKYLMLVVGVLIGLVFLICKGDKDSEILVSEQKDKDSNTIGVNEKSQKKKTEREKKKENDIWSDIDFDNGGIYSFVDSDETNKVSDCGRVQRMAGREGMETRVLSHDGGRVRFVSLNQQLTEDLLIESWPCVMGSRQEDTQLTIPMIGISRRHALLEKEEDGVYLSDLHSTNGTYVNHVRLKDGEKRLLLVEDIVQLADIQYMYCGTG